MTRLSEQRDVQDALIDHRIGIGWDYLPPDEILNARGGDLREPFLVPIVAAHSRFPSPPACHPQPTIPPPTQLFRYSNPSTRVGANRQPAESFPPIPSPRPCRSPAPRSPRDPAAAAPAPRMNSPSSWTAATHQADGRA